MLTLSHIISSLSSSTHPLLAHVDDATDAVAGLHVAECLVDLVEGLAVRDELVDLEVAVHVVGDQAGELRAALYAAEGTAFPDAAGDELEGWGVLVGGCA